MLTTRIVNLYTVENLHDWVKQKNNIYIGRARKSLQASIWGNPFKIGPYDRDTAVLLYEQYLLGNRELLRSLPDLKGKTLGCWCAPLRCHGEILHRLENMSFASISSDILDKLSSTHTPEVLFKNSSFSPSKSDPELDTFCEKLVLNMFNSFVPSPVPTVQPLCSLPAAKLPIDDTTVASSPIPTSSTQDKVSRDVPLSAVETPCSDSMGVLSLMPIDEPSQDNSSMEIPSIHVKELPLKDSSFQHIIKATCDDPKEDTPLVLASSLVPTVKLPCSSSTIPLSSIPSSCTSQDRSVLSLEPHSSSLPGATSPETLDPLPVVIHLPSDEERLFEELFTVDKQPPEERGLFSPKQTETPTDSVNNCSTMQPGLCSEPNKSVSEPEGTPLLGEKVSEPRSLRCRTSLHERESSQFQQYFNSDSDSEKDDSDDSQYDFLKSSQPQQFPLSKKRAAILVEEKDICKLRNNRKKDEKIMSLDVEKFPAIAVETKSAMFRTERPLAWYEGIRQHIAKQNVSSSFDYRKHQNGLISISECRAVFNRKEVIHIKINFVTGVLTAKGPSLKTWIQSDFEHIEKVIHNQRSKAISETSTLDNKSEETDKHEEKNLKDLIKSNDNGMKDELKSIETEIESLNVALQSIEQGLLKLTDRMNNIDTTLKDDAAAYENKRMSMEEGLDCKISIFQEVIESSTKKQVNKLTTDLNNKISGVKDAFTKFKTEVEEKMDSYISSCSPSEHTTTSEKGRSAIDSGLIVGIQEDITELDKNYDSRYTSLSLSLANMQEDLKSENESRYQALNTCISVLQQDINTLKASQTTSRFVPRTIDNSLSAEDRSPAPDTDQMRTDDKTKIIMCMDSNGKYLDHRRLWDLDGTKHCICYTLSDVNKVIDQKVKYASLKYFMLSVGCNDLDHNDASKVFDDLKKIVTKLQTLYTHIKIIDGEVTARMDSKDELVKEINILINEYAVSKDSIYTYRNSNMCDKKLGDS